MNAPEAQRTRLMARIIGPLFIILPIALIVRLGTLDLLMPAFFQNAPLVLVTGVFTLTLGVILVAAHHHWTSGAAVVISVIGWLTALRGFMLTLFPHIAARFAAGVSVEPIVAIVFAIVGFLVGLWLTYVGWFARQPLKEAP